MMQEPTESSTPINSNPETEFPFRDFFCNKSTEPFRRRQKSGKGSVVMMGGGNQNEKRKVNQYAVIITRNFIVVNLQKYEIYVKFLQKNR